jgi:RNA polymerase sigma-70 factor (ECF subfamily)
MIEPQDLVQTLAGDAAPVDRAVAEGELCLLLAPRLRLYGLRHLRDEAAAANLVQEALIVLLQATREGRIEDLEHVDRFVLGICRNLISRSRRDQRRSKSFESAVLPLATAELPPAFSSVDSGRLALCLGMMGSREQKVVRLTFQEDRSADGIAAELTTSAGNVRVLRHRAIAALRGCMDGALS